MPELLKIVPTVFSSGERFPVLVTEGGMPEFYANTFLTGALRIRNKQYNTLYNAAGAVKHVRAWELLYGIDLCARMTTGDFLQTREVDTMVDALWHRYGFLKDRLALAGSDRGELVPLHGSFPGRGSLPPAALLNRQTVAGRMVYAQQYLKYLGQYAINRQRDEQKNFLLVKELESLLISLARRAPEGYAAHEDAEYQRLGLTYEAEKLLVRAIKPGACGNPWSRKTQHRNYLIIMILLSLGLRAGELLSLRIEDIDLRENTIFIRRLPHDKDDPRVYEPYVKTMERRLRMKDALAALIHEYVVDVRRHIKGARKHDFLLVSTRNGAPLSFSSYNSIFVAVREKVPGVPADFCSHMCRHTWNDRFSDFCDANGVDEERERKIRCRIMGWAPDSKMPLLYTKRSTQAAVDQHLLGSQEFIFSWMGRDDSEIEEEDEY